MLYSWGHQPMAHGPNLALIKNMMALFKSGGAKKRSPKKLNGLAKKYMIWPSTKKAYNFFIFWPTYHKRLATLLYNVQYIVLYF